MAPDGNVYTEIEFLQYFDGLDEWYAASVVPLPQKANGRPRKGRGHQAAVDAGLIVSRRKQRAQERTQAITLSWRNPPEAATGTAGANDGTKSRTLAVWSTCED